MSQVWNRRGSAISEHTRQDQVRLSGKSSNILEILHHGPFEYTFMNGILYAGYHCLRSAMRVSKCNLSALCGFGVYTITMVLYLVEVTPRLIVILSACLRCLALRIYATLESNQFRCTKLMFMLCVLTNTQSMQCMFDMCLDEVAYGVYLCRLISINLQLHMSASQRLKLHHRLCAFISRSICRLGVRHPFPAENENHDACWSGLERHPSGW